MRRLSTLILCLTLLAAFVIGMVAPQGHAEDTRKLVDCEMSYVFDENGPFIFKCCIVEDYDCQCSYYDCFDVPLSN